MSRKTRTHDAGAAGLYVTDIQVLRLHYAETLKAWRYRFNVNRKHVAELYDERSGACGNSTDMVVSAVPAHAPSEAAE